MPRQRLPVQYFADILDQLKGVNARLDTLISQQAPAEVSEPAGSEPERVRLEEPARPDEVRTTLQVGERVLPRAHPSEQVAADMVAQIDEGIDVENDAPTSPNDGRERCREQTKRGNICGKPLPCRYHG